MRNLIIQVLNLYMIIILVRVVISWIRINQNNPFVRIVYELTEPVLAPVRNILPVMGGFDISPIIVFFLIRFIIGAL